MARSADLTILPLKADMATTMPSLPKGLTTPLSKVVLAITTLQQPLKRKHLQKKLPGRILGSFFAVTTESHGHWLKKNFRRLASKTGRLILKNKILPQPSENFNISQHDNEKVLLIVFIHVS